MIPTDRVGNNDTSLIVSLTSADCVKMGAVRL